VKHVVDAELQRLEVHRRGQRGVDQRLDVVLLAQGHEALDVDHAEMRVGGRLADQQLGVLIDRRFHPIVVAGRDLVCDHAETAQVLDAEFPGAVITLVEQDDLVAGAELRQQQADHGRHSRGVQQRRGAPVQGGQLALGHLLGGIAVAGVLLTGQLLLDEVDCCLGVGEGVGGGTEDRVGHRTFRLLAGLAGVNRRGRQAATGRRSILVRRMVFLAHGNATLPFRVR